MKKIIITAIILILLFIYFVPPYNELNNIMIIDKIKVEKDSNKYKVNFREVIPKKNNNGISYTYKYHKVKVNSINKAKSTLEKRENKKLYLSKVKSLTTNINPYLIIKHYNIKPKNITIQ